MFPHNYINIFQNFYQVISPHFTIFLKFLKIIDNISKDFFESDH